MKWVKFSEIEPELHQWVTIACDGRPIDYWMGIYIDFKNQGNGSKLGLGKPIYWLNIPKFPEEVDENQPT